MAGNDEQGAGDDAGRRDGVAAGNVLCDEPFGVQRTMLLMIDNYDSFTYNLVQYFGELGADVSVFRNDRVSLRQIERLAPRQIVISPGPCAPDQAGISLEVIRCFTGKVPILGVCLGHQAIGQAFGGNIVRGKRVMHGKTSLVHHNGRGLFAGLNSPFRSTRYHSLVIEEKSLPECLAVDAWTQEHDAFDEIMAVRHKEHAVAGVQFHPESIMSDYGHELLQHFLDVRFPDAGI